MPIYEFVCQHCNNHFESIQSFSTTTMPACPVCESQDVARQMSRPAIHFKGSGWYITDSKKADKQSANGTANGDGGGEGDRSEQATESKAETGGDAKTSTTAAGTAKKESAKSSSASE